MTVEFHKGFNIITGETGAGKSLIINAIDLLFGSKVNQQMVRLAGEPISIEATFKSNGKNLVLSMDYTKGKTQRFLDGKKIAKSNLLELCSSLMQFQKQHDSNNLLNPNKHIDFLDNYCMDSDMLSNIKNAYYNYTNSEKLYLDMLDNASHYNDKLSLYRYQFEELNSVNLSEDEEVSVNKKYKKYNHSKKIRDILNNYNMENSSNKSLLATLEKLVKSLGIYTDIDTKINEIVSRLEQLIIELKDVSEEAFDLEKKYYFNLDELELLESQLQKYEEIKRKYGGSIKSAIDFKGRINKELASMPDFDDKIKILEQDFLNNKSNYEKIARSVSNVRKKASIKMSDKINQYLINMDMPDAKIEIKIN